MNSSDPDLFSVAEAIPGLIQGRRWYADKTEELTSVLIEEAAPIDVEGLPVVLVIAELGFRSGRSSRYFMPLAQRNSGWIDALQFEEVREWLRQFMSAGELLTGSAGQFIGQTTTAKQGEPPGASRMVTTEQSNSSVIYGDQQIAKLFRRLIAGENPEIEMARFFSSSVEPQAVTNYFGDLTYQSDSGKSYSLAVLQQFVPGSHDAYTTAVADLARGSEMLDPKLLGGATAKLHRSLLHPAAPDPDFDPKVINSRDIGQWQSSYEESLETTLELVRNARATASENIREVMNAFLDRGAQLASLADGFALLDGRLKTRVHGDFHLGQVLISPELAIYFVDFEGEPARSMEERRMLTSPLKDLAGMTRSFSYATGAALKSLEELNSFQEAEATERGLDLRHHFLAAYEQELGPDAELLLPAGNHDFRLALASWEADKALYEIRYELANRPDWLWLPITSALRLM